MTIRLLHKTVEDRERNHRIGVQFGWGGNFESLERYVANLQATA